MRDSSLYTPFGTALDQFQTPLFQRRLWLHRPYETALGSCIRRRIGESQQFKSGFRPLEKLHRAFETA